MPILHPSPRRPRIAVAALLAALAAVHIAGCGRPLALQQEFFSPASGTAARIGVQTQHTVSHHRALQAAQHACGRPMPATTAPDEAGDGPDLGAPAAREALADLCAGPARPPVAARGATSNAYETWVEHYGKEHELPDVSETAASAAGGS